MSGFIRIKGEPTWRTQEEIDEDYTTVSSLKNGAVYEFIVASVDGAFTTESDAREIDLPLSGI